MCLCVVTPDIRHATLYQIRYSARDVMRSSMNGEQFIIKQCKRDCVVIQYRFTPPLSFFSPLSLSLSLLSPSLPLSLSPKLSLQPPNMHSDSLFFSLSLSLSLSGPTSLPPSLSLFLYLSLSSHLPTLLQDSCMPKLSLQPPNMHSDRTTSS